MIDSGSAVPARSADRDTTIAEILDEDSNIGEHDDTDHTQVQSRRRESKHDHVAVVALLRLQQRLVRLMLKVQSQACALISGSTLVPSLKQYMAIKYHQPVLEICHFGSDSSKFCSQ